MINADNICLSVRRQNCRIYVSKVLKFSYEEHEIDNDILKDYHHSKLMGKVIKNEESDSLS
jgi:hypothetical protein